MSTKWDSQARNWWRQCTPDERMDIFQNILKPELERMSHTDEFRMLMQAHIAKAFFTARTWKMWDTLCHAFGVSPHEVFGCLARNQERNKKE